MSRQILRPNVTDRRGITGGVRPGREPPRLFYSPQAVVLSGQLRRNSRNFPTRYCTSPCRHVYISHLPLKGTITKAHSSYRDTFHMLYWSSSPRAGMFRRRPICAGAAARGIVLPTLRASTCVRACVLLSSIRSRAPFACPRFSLVVALSSDLHLPPSLVVDMPPNERLPRCGAGY